MATPRPDAPLRLRDAARLAGLSPKALKYRLRTHERATGAALVFRHGPRGHLHTTLALCRLAFGDAFGVPDLDDRVELLERRERGLRADVNAIARRVAKILSMRDEFSQRSGIKTQSTDPIIVKRLGHAPQIAPNRPQPVADRSEARGRRFAPAGKPDP